MTGNFIAKNSFAADVTFNYFSYVLFFWLADLESADLEDFFIKIFLWAKVK